MAFLLADTRRQNDLTSYHPPISCSLAGNSRWNGVIVEIETDVDRFAGTHWHDEICPERVSGQGQQARLLFGEDPGDGAAVVPRLGPLMGDPVAREQSLPVAFSERGEGTARPERFADITNGALHAAFLVARPHLTGTRHEVIMGAQFQQSWIEVNLVAYAFEHALGRLS
jgi:hypothetical protein